ncbi:MAG: DUF2867 domain-containing protein [Azospirillaceae bacterium]|nr:DUF2867 domain-containing protein [Azospirillaceae bacterium]
MTIQEVTPPADVWALLPGAQFADTFRLTLPATSPVAELDALDTARRMMATTPPWVARLTALRNTLVRPFGLKAPETGGTQGQVRIGIFPLISHTADRVIMGMPDKHLDFRAVIDVATTPEGRQVSTTTVVRTHNLLGRTYLATILPFHRLVVRAMLGQLTPP